MQQHLDNYLVWLKNNEWEKSFGFETRSMNREFANHLKENEPKHFQYLRLSFALGIIYNNDEKNIKTSLWSKLIQQTDEETTKKYLAFYIFFMAEIRGKKFLREFLKEHVLHLEQVEQNDYLNYLEATTGNLKNQNKFLEVYDTAFMLECLKNIKDNNNFAETMIYYFNSFEDSFQAIFLDKIDIWEDYGTEKFLNYLQNHKKKMEDGRKATLLGEYFETYTSSILNNDENNPLSDLDKENKDKMLALFPKAISAKRISTNAHNYNCPKADILINNNDGTKLFISCKANDKKICIHNTKWATLINKNPCLNPDNQTILESINWVGENFSGWKSLNQTQQKVFMIWIKENYLRLHQELIFGTPSVDGILVNEGKIYKAFKPYYLDQRKFFEQLEEFYHKNKNNEEKLISITEDGIPSTPFILFKTMKTAKKFRIMGRIKKMAEFANGTNIEINAGSLSPEAEIFKNNRKAKI